MRYPRIIATFNQTPLAILPEKAEEIRRFLQLKAFDEDVAEDDIQQITAGRRPMQTQTFGRVGVLPIFGVISQRVGGLERASGGISTEEIGATLEDMTRDRGIKTILMSFDSPGGSVFGVQELADKIRELGKQKKIVAIADSVAASAAYWLASQASEFTVTPGGQVGSIGVISAHVDMTKAEEMMGVKTTLITSAPHKAEFASENILSADARAEMQAKVNHYHGVFIKAVARGRGVTEARVEKDFGGGRMVTAQQAKERGMVDSVATLETVLHRLGADGSEPGANARLAAIRARAIQVEQENFACSP